ncbi:hypothetical protein Dimus_024012 [Dionaea muscipula]
MPGNEASDRVHNFFQTGNLSQSQNHTQSVEGNWTLFNNNPWAPSDRQLGGIFSSKHYSPQQADSERGQGNPFSLGSYGPNYAQSSPRTEFSKSQSQSQQHGLNGFMHATQVSHTRHNESNVGLDLESDRHYPISKGLPILDSHQRSSQQHSNSNPMSFERMESPINFDFLGNQQQISGHQSGTEESVQRQQSGLSEVQQMQQQFMLKQMQDLQRQHELWQLEALQRNSFSQISGIPNQGISHPPGSVNDTAIHDGSSFPWSSQVMAGNPNWLQRGVSATVQGYSNGVMITPEQGQALRFMGMLPPQTSQSLYGVPVSGSRVAGPFIHGQIDKPGMQQLPVHNSSLSGNQHVFFPEQTMNREGANAMKPVYENKKNEHGSGPGPGDLGYVECFNQIQQRNVTLKDSGAKKELAISSETLPEKSEKHVTSSQSAVALDPTEEKILFGGDDNIWEAFGGSLSSGTGGSNNLDGAFPSLQSGSWSALMQSAVAECGSSAVALQGQWGGVGVQNSGSIAANHQNSIFRDSRKKEAAWAEDSQAAPLRSRPIANDANLSTSYGHSSAFPASFLNQPRENVQATSSLQSSEEGRNWLDNSRPPTPADGRQVENVNFWSHQQNLSLQGSQQGSQSMNAANVFRFIESAAQNGVMASNALHGVDHDKAISANVGHAGALSRHDSVPNANFEFTGTKFNAKDESGIHNSSTIKANQDASQKLLENRNLNFWRTVSSGKSGIDDSKNQQQLSQSSQVLDSSLNSSFMGGSEMRGAGNADRRGNFSDSHSSNISRHATSCSFRENVGSDIGNIHSFPGEKHKSSDPVNIKSVSSRKFQHHPMGDVDIVGEPVYGPKHPMQLHATVHPLLGGPRSQGGQPMFLHPATDKSLGSRKLQGVATNIPGDVTASYGRPSSDFHPGYIPGEPALLSMPGHTSTSDKPMPPSQNMLELLHKVDQPNEQHSAWQVGSSRLSCAPEAQASDRAVKWSKQSPASQTFGLQLAPPSQGLPVPNFMVGGESALQNLNSSSLSNTASCVEEDKGNVWLSPRGCAQSLPTFRETPQEGCQSHKYGVSGQDVAEPVQSSIQGNFSSPALGSGCVRSHVQNRDITDAGRKMTNDQPRQSANLSVTSAAARTLHNDLASPREVSQLTNLEQCDAKPRIHQNLLLDVSVPPQHSVHDRVDSGSLSTMAPSVPAYSSSQQLLGSQSVNASNVDSSQLQPNHSVEPRSGSQQEQDYEDFFRKETAVSSHVSGEENPGKKIDGLIMSDDSPSGSATSQKGIEAFGRSLRPSSHMYSSYSVMQSMQPVKNTEMDDSDRQLKRFKGSDGGAKAEHIAGKAGLMLTSGSNPVTGNTSVSHTLISPGDTKMVNVSPETNNDQESSSSFLLQPAKNSGADYASRAEQPHISPKMAPTWFDQYGSLKNGQFPLVHDARISQTISCSQQQFMNKDSKILVADHSSGQENVAIDTDQMGNSQQSTSTSMLGDQFSSPNSLVHGAISTVLASLGPKKRKSAMSDLFPWCKEVTLGSQRVQTISSAEVEWARAANRLVEKVEDETDISGEILLGNRSRRRLILTTQLMQQLLRPPPAGILSLDANSNYETVTYFVARLALGDACSMSCCLESDSYLGSENSRSENPKTPGRNRDHYFSKLVEGFTYRAKNLENDLLRLDKQALTLDLRLECQDLERLSIINRFAKFHGRGQSEGAEMSASLSTAAIMQRPAPQRYVTAHPIPMNLPDGIQCLSL